MPKYNVHAYKVIRIKVEGVEAESPEKACEWVEDNLTDRGGRGATSNMGVPCPAFVSYEEMDGDERPLEYLVDEQGDTDYSKSCWLWKDHKTPETMTCHIVDLAQLLTHRLGERVIDDILRANRDQLPLLLGLDEDLDERISSILKE